MPLKISRILHAGYLFESDATVIAFDPIVENPFSRNCHAFPDVHFDHAKFAEIKLDAVFISHFHDDHCSLESLDFLDRATPIYLYCIFDQLFDLIRALGFEQVHALSIDAPVVIGAFEITPKRALDADVDSMFHIRAAGLNVLNVVDAWMDPATLAELARFGQNERWDMVLWPFQAMREIDVIAPTRAAGGPPLLPEDWIGELRQLNPRYIVASSCQFIQEAWSWYNHALFPITYRQFQEEVEAALPATPVLRLNPSVSVLLDHVSLQTAAPLDWVLPVGDQDVDYHYVAGITPPATADIARHFAALDAGQTEIVLDYCRAGLLDKYAEMELADDSFFQKPRCWRLSLYDHDGAATHFFYRTDGDRIERAGEGEAALNWSTEVPISKVYAALVLGESLTSMYMRINEQLFDAGTEADLQDADIVDDPLIRCLFNDSIGAYQAAQLKRIQARKIG